MGVSLKDLTAALSATWIVTAAAEMISEEILSGEEWRGLGAR